jgi:hypothetical protein
MPTFFNAFGLRFFIYSEEHKPLHVHVQKGRAKAKFTVEPTIELVENSGLKAQEVSLAKSLIEENRKLIIERWNEHLNKRTK